jgi:hypothetical protein
MRVVSVFMRVMVIELRSLLGTEVMLVKMENAQQEQHQDQAQHQPPDRGIDTASGSQQRQAVRQQMVEGDAQHQAGNQAHRQLRAGVRHAYPGGQQSAQQRKSRNGQTVDEQ